MAENKLQKKMSYKIYFNKNGKINTKESFKFIVEKASEFINSIPNPSVLDIGCATGDLVYYLSKMFPQAKCVGLDVRNDLLESARKEVPNIKFILSDILNKNSLPDEKFDVIFMIGVHPIFDDVFHVFDNIISMLKENGRAYIFSIFNDSDIDTLVKVKDSSVEGPWKVGWNLFSKKSVKDYLKNKDLPCEFIDWEIPIDIPKTDDPLRSWTFKDEHGKRMVINGTGILHTFSLLLISK
jgi:ubiquinone/menaquinone biosynthesis C-methylase UbiE